MRKVFAFGLILVVSVVVVASVPDGQLVLPLKMRSAENPLATVAIQSDVADAYAHGDENGLISERPGGRNPLDVVDSTLFIDSLEGAYASWVSEDLAYSPDTYWHLEGFHALGGSGDAIRCSNPAIACPAQNGGYDNHWLQYLVFDAVNLVGTTAPQFAISADWAVEVPGGEPVGYDLWDSWNAWASTDGGTTWSVLTPSSPPYTGTSSYAFGVEWGMGPGIPAYGAASGGHTPCIFPLTAYIGQSNVKVRVAFCSDPAFASIDACATTWGLVVDSVRISDGATTLFSNDGVAGGWNGMGGPESPDVWVFESDSTYGDVPGYHSANSAWNGEQTAYFVNRSIASYPVTLPAGYQKLKLTYWVWCDLPDFTGGGGGSLEDYYRIMVSTDDGGTWTQVCYDYAYDNGEGSSLAGWVRRTKGLVGGLQTIDISLVTRTEPNPPAITVRVAFEMSTDGNDDGGIGTGLHIDDVEFIAQRAQATDLATRNIVVPYPTTLGLLRAWSFDFVNEGLTALSPVRGKLQFTRPDGTTLPPTGDSTVVSAGALNYGETRTIPRTWTNPDQAGAWRIRTIANATGEQDRSNDTTRTPSNVTQNDDSSLAVFVRPTNVFELGYGRRTVASAYLNPRYTHFTPLADGVPAASADTIDITQLRIMWRYNEELADSGGRVRIDFWEEGVDTFHTGALINSITTRIDTSETIGAAGRVHWWEMDLTTTPGLSNRTGNFWVSVTQLDSFVINGSPTAAPLPLGISPAGVTPDGHSYYLNVPTNTLTQSGGRVLFNVLIRPTQTSTPAAVNNLVINRQSTSNDIRLTWGPAARANGYFVWRLTTPTQVYNTGTLLTPLPITATTFTDVGALGAGAKFFYVVIATN